MKTFVELRSNAFPPYDTEDTEVNPGSYGKRLAELLYEGLTREGEVCTVPFNEDWGWMVEVENEAFPLWIGVGNLDDDPGGFLCFIEPHQEVVRKLFKKISTRERVEQLQERLERVLASNPEIHEVKWWTHEEYTNPRSHGVA